MAKRLGIKTIRAVIQEEKSAWFLPLPEVAAYGEHRFTYPASGRRGGGMAFLWVQGRPFVNTGFEFLKAMDFRMCTGGKQMEILNGLSYGICINIRNAFPIKLPEADLTVTISPDHEKAKIWLIERTGGRPRTVCRLGLWEERHEAFVDHWLSYRG